MIFEPKPYSSRFEVPVVWVGQGFHSVIDVLTQCTGNVKPGWREKVGKTLDCLDTSTSLGFLCFYERPSISIRPVGWVLHLRWTNPEILDGFGVGIQKREDDRR